MKKLLICLCLVASSAAFANEADTKKLNDLIYKALVARDYDKARWLAVTVQQKEYVETEIVRLRREAKAKKTLSSNSGAIDTSRCYAHGTIVVCN